MFYSARYITIVSIKEIFLHLLVIKRHGVQWLLGMYSFQKKVDRAMTKMTIAQYRTNDDTIEHRARLWHLHLLPITTTCCREK